LQLPQRVLSAISRIDSTQISRLPEAKPKVGGAYLENHHGQEIDNSAPRKRFEDSGIPLGSSNLGYRTDSMTSGEIRKKRRDNYGEARWAKNEARTETGTSPLGKWARPIFYMCLD
jgi:hypothetical protein